MEAGADSILGKGVQERTARERGWEERQAGLSDLVQSTVPGLRQASTPAFFLRALCAARRL